MRVTLARVAVVLSWLATGFLSVNGAFAQGVDLRLVDAVRGRNAAAVATLLKQKVDVNATQPDGATALHWAAHWDDGAVADQLLAAGARVGAANDYGVTPLFLAATNGSAVMVEKLLAAGADANGALPTGETVLMTAARTGSAAAVAKLLARGADVNAKQRSKEQTALMWAVAEGHHDVVQLLIDRGADVEAKTVRGFTPLLFAAREGNLDVARLLMAKGADVNGATPDGSTPILVATVRGRVALARFLLDHGANPEGDFTAAGYTPLHWASTKSEGVITFDYPEAPGEWAALSGIPSRQDKIDLIDALVTHGANVNARVSKDLPRYGFTLFKRNYLQGGTPFYLASLVGDVEVMRRLLAYGGDPAFTANDGTTSLMVAAGIAHADNESRVPEADRLAAVKLAVELGADVNALNRGGFNVVHAAAFAGLDSVIAWAADHGAKLSEPAQNGQTPLGIAEGNNLSGFFADRPSTAALLRKLGATSRGAVTLDSFLEKQRAAAAGAAVPSAKKP